MFIFVHYRFFKTLFVPEFLKVSEWFQRNLSEPYRNVPETDSFNVSIGSLRPQQL